MHRCHEDTCSALHAIISHFHFRILDLQCHDTYLRCRTLPPQPLNLPIPIHLVVLQYRQLGLLPLMLDLLGRRIHLLLALLGATSQTQDEMESRLFLDVVVGEGASVFELFAGEDETLLVGRDTLFVCLVGIRRINILRMTEQGIANLGSWPLHCRLCRRIRPRG